VVSFFSEEKIGRHHEFAALVTPTLVTPLVSAPFCIIAIRWPPCKIYEDRPRGIPPSGLRTKYSDVGPLADYISENVQDIGGKLVLITNRKSYMSFRTVPKSVTLYDL